MLVFVEIYPREGTETVSQQSIDTIHIVEIYPREGTETTIFCGALMFCQLKFIPVRGRKRSVVAQHQHISAVEIYPREGTETWIGLA